MNLTVRATRVVPPSPLFGWSMTPTSRTVTSEIVRSEVIQYIEGPQRKWGKFVTGQSSAYLYGEYANFRIKPIEVTITAIEENEFVASFPEAGISISGDSGTDALIALRAELIDLFQIFSEVRERLGPEPKRQLEVLTKYIGKV